MANRSQAGLSDLERAAIQILIDRELTAAVRELRREKMGATTDLRNSLGEDSLRVRFGSNKKFVTMGDTTVELDATATDDEVARALNLEKIDKAVVQPSTEKPNMSVSGLAPGILQAKLAELRQRGQERLAQGVAKIDAAHSAGLSKIDAAADEAAKKIDAEIDSTLHEFAESTNGGPA